MPRWNDQDAGEGKRNIAIAMTNAVFSKLIKMGRELGKTPQRMAQELFEDAYAARCMGKAKLAGQVAIAAEGTSDLRLEIEKLGATLHAQAQLLAAEQQRTLDAKAAHRIDREELKVEITALRTATDVLTAERDTADTRAADFQRKYEEQLEKRQQVVDQLVECQDLLIAARSARDEAQAEILSLREAAKGQLVVVNQASEILKREAEKPAQVEPCWAQPPSAAQLRAIKAMKAASNSPAAIARQLGVSIETVRAALA